MGTEKEEERLQTYSNIFCQSHPIFQPSDLRVHPEPFCNTVLIEPVWILSIAVYMAPYSRVENFLSWVILVNILYGTVK